MEKIFLFFDSTFAWFSHKAQVPHASQALVELGRKVQWDVDKAAVFAQVHPRKANSELRLLCLHIRLERGGLLVLASLDFYRYQFGSHLQDKIYFPVCAFCKVPYIPMPRVLQLLKHIVLDERAFEVKVAVQD